MTDWIDRILVGTGTSRDELIRRVEAAGQVIPVITNRFIPVPFQGFVRRTETANRDVNRFNYWHRIKIKEAQTFFDLVHNRYSPAPPQ